MRCFGRARLAFFLIAAALFVPAHGADTIQLSSGSNSVGNNQNVWVGQGELTSDSSGSQFFDRNLLMASGGTVDTLGIHRNNLDVTGGDSTATLYLNGAPTSLVVALSGPTAFASASVPVPFSAGDTLGVYYESSVGVPHEVDATVEVTYATPGPDDVIVLSSGSNAVGNNQTVWVGQGELTNDSGGFQFFDRNLLMASGGTVDTLGIHRNNLDVTGGDSTATLYLNGAPTSLVVALSGPTAFASASVPVAFSAGDTLGVYYESSVGVPHEVDATVEVTYAEPGPADAILLSSGSNSVGNNQTVWVGQGELTNDSGGFQFFDRNLLMASGGTVDTLGIHRNNLDVTGGDSTATLYLNGAPTSLVLALSGPTAFASASVPVAFSAGDTLGVYYESSVGVPHEVDATVEVTFTEPGPADAILLSSGSSSVGGGQKVWVGQGALTSDSSGFQFFDRNALMASSGTVDTLGIHRNNLDVVGGDSTATLWVNGSSTSLVVSLSGATGFGSASAPVSFSAGDTLGVYYESSVGIAHEVDATVEVTYAEPGPADAILLSSGSSSVGGGQKVWVGQGELTSDSIGSMFFDRNVLMASSGTVDKLAIHRNNLDASGGDSTATLWVNGSSTSLVVALSGTEDFASASVPVGFSAGDTLGVYYESSVGPHEVDATVEVTYAEPGPADAILLSTGSISVGSGQKVWVGQGALTPDSSGFQFFDRNALMASAGTVDKLAIHRNNLDASGGDSTATLYLNGAPTSLVVALSGTTAFASASVPVGFSAGDTLGVYYESSVGPHEVDATVEVSYAEVPGPGAVPDGSGDEAPLRASRDLIDPMLINLTWSRSCGTAIDFAVYEGTLGDPESLTAVTCSTGGEASFQLAVPAGDVFWVVVPITATEEGSYGEDSSGSERGPATSPCAGVFHPVSCPAAF